MPVASHHEMCWTLARSRIRMLRQQVRTYNSYIAETRILVESLEREISYIEREITRPEVHNPVYPPPALLVRAPVVDLEEDDGSQ